MKQRKQQRKRLPMEEERFLQSLFANLPQLPGIYQKRFEESARKIHSEALDAGAIASLPKLH